LLTLLLPPVYFHFGLHVMLRNSVPQTKLRWNGPVVGGTKVTGQTLRMASFRVQGLRGILRKRV
jgi:hypothetical protein